jgi:hypothetical protein
VCIYIYIYTCIYIHISMCVCTYIYIYIHVYIHIYIYIHIYMYVYILPVFSSFGFLLSHLILTLKEPEKPTEVEPPPPKAESPKVHLLPSQH